MDQSAEEVVTLDRVRGGLVALVTCLQVREERVLGASARRCRGHVTAEHIFEVAAAARDATAATRVAREDESDRGRTVRKLVRGSLGRRGR